MAFRRWILTTVVILVVSFSSQSHRPTAELSRSDTCTITNEVFQAGEKVVYKIYYNLGFVWIAAGEVSFEVAEKGDLYHISAMGRTYKSYDWIFKVRDYYDSFIDKQTMRPKRTIRKVLEGNYRLYDDVKYKHEHQIAISRKGKSKEKADEEEVALVECTHDILSSFYSMRNIDFSTYDIDSRIPMNVYLDRKIYNISVVYKGVEEKKRVRGLGPCNTLLFEPELIVGNVFKDNEGMKIWVSNDQNRIPLLIESPISVGSVKAVLREYKGLKYPVDL